MTLITHTALSLFAAAAVLAPHAAIAKTESTAPSATSLNMEESSECMMVTIPFMFQAMMFQPEDEVAVTRVAEFWADYADTMGEPSEADMAKLEAKSDGMLAQLETIETEADMAAFVAPYQAKFDACEEMRKTLQAG